MTTDKTANDVVKPEVAEEPKRPDPFDLTALKKRQNVHERTGVKKTRQVKVRKPSKEYWLQSTPYDSQRIVVEVIELKEDNEIYYVSPHIALDIEGEPCFGQRELVLYQTRQGNLFFCPIRLPDASGRLDDWNSSMREFMYQPAKWQRIFSNRQLGIYDQEVATADWPSPDWPEDDITTLLRDAFRGHIIDSVDHPQLQQLRGQC